ncbi:CD225/dispanin family protein [Xanthomarina sp.]|uniref:CD225/dispanin family protein n=1 Tax=Xanthomarina sp. TaxID=1931211 RepID=UPI002B855639|nr:CD225/dispanin family protein [Xanthomarina sp.]HLV39616.1 CD225/dispanin family protein [Xanthomarina sp.]
MEVKPTRPNSYLALAIISTILCCLPFGIVSIIYATKVNALYEDGHYEKATSASKNAKTWGIISIAIALLGWLIYVLIFGAALFGILLSEANY